MGILGRKRRSRPTTWQANDKKLSTEHQRSSATLNRRERHNEMSMNSRLNYVIYWFGCRSVSHFVGLRLSTASASVISDNGCGNHTVCELFTRLLTNFHPLFYIRWTRSRGVEWQHSDIPNLTPTLVWPQAQRKAGEW